LELDGERVVLAGAVHAVTERLHQRPDLGVADPVPGRARGAREVHLPVEAVAVDRRCADDGRQLAPHLSALEIHLEQPVASLCVAGREVDRRLGVSLDSGDTVVVVAELCGAVR
jgi:hypothetical protein